MKKFLNKILLSFLASFLLALPFCHTKKSNSPSPDLINDIGLKKGDVISCGPPSAEFGSVAFEMYCGESIQKEFNKAISILHSFEYDEAEKVFAKIIETRPDCAMAYWGIAMCNYHPLWAPPNKEELEKGAKAIAIAQSISAKTAKEKRYIDAMAAFFSNRKTLEHKARSMNYKNAMEKMHIAYPDDKEAAVFYALALDAVADPSDKTFANQKKAYEILSALHAGQPDHPGIVHYIIHSYDYPGLATLALPAARRYAAIALASAHAQHMPSHIFTRLGLWDECIQSNLDAAASARCYAEGTGNNAHWDEELHMIDYLVYGYLQKGENTLAKEQWDYLKTIREVKPYNFKVAYAFASVPARYVLENKLWKEAAGLASHIGEEKWNDYPWQKSIIHFARSLGAAHMGKIADAKKEHSLMGLLYDTLVKQKDIYKANQVMVQIQSAAAWILLAEGKKLEALKLMEAAAGLEDHTEKHPVTPGEVLPARELLGDMLLALNKPAEALVAYEACLKSRPHRFNSVYSAALAAEKTGNHKKAGDYYRQLLLVAGSGSSTRTELQQARMFLASRKSSLATLGEIPN